ncbi:MAG: T9SS type A sorting domain-containing protein [Bacteroidales bacterium]|nr:T9SS type A sorting domain-containing protein [Bacteroidales bacterium]
MKNQRFYFFAFALLFGAKVFAQEWEHSYEYSMNDSLCYTYQDAIELTDGCFAVATSFYYKSGYGDFYSAQPAIAKFSADGEELKRTNYFRPGYCTTSTAPYLFKNEEGELFALMTYNPDHDSTYFNHFLHYDNPPEDAILGLYKLDDDLSIIESYEYSMPIDTFENRGESLWDLWPNELSGNLFLFSAFIDEGNIVGAYFKTVSFDYHNPRGNDSLFLFKMNFEGEILEQKGYDWGVSGANHQTNERRTHFVATDSGYIYYFGNLFGGTNYQGVAYYYDKHLDFQKKRFLKHSDLPTLNSFTNISVKRSRHNTTYLVASSEVQNSNTDRNNRLYELDDNGPDSMDIIPIERYIERGTEQYELPAYMQSVDLADGNSLFFAYALNIGFYSEMDSWMEIEHLDSHFNAISTVFYNLMPEGVKEVNSWAKSILTTSDGGALFISKSTNLDDRRQCWTTVTKFSAKSLQNVEVEEVHANGLKVAIAYPNPGGSEMHIRTTVENAAVEVYDMNGRLIHSQTITENVTGIDAGAWAEGIYVWKVLSGERIVESGKWVKE